MSRDAGQQPSGRDQRGTETTDTAEQISRLHEAAETHHRVFRIVDGADDDWASWYSDWLTTLSDLPAWHMPGARSLLSRRPPSAASCGTPVIRGCSGTSGTGR